MEKQRIRILDESSIDAKLRRMAYQIWERNSRRTHITLVGIEQGGSAIARNLARLLADISPLQADVLSLKLNKRKPLSEISGLDRDLNGQAIVLVDDVANSGKTLLYALKPLLDCEPESIAIAVLVDRKHKSFPISPDIVGHSVATTLQDHIEVEIEQDRIMAAYLM